MHQGRIFLQSNYSQLYGCLILWGENMVRIARLESDTGYYHIMARGNNKEMIFRHSSEKQYFLRELQDRINEGDISVLSYCIMDNHVHLLINADLDLMADALKRTNIKFAMRYNKKYDRVGHVFQGRYKSEVINTEQYLLGVIRYIHNNPVKAGIVFKAENYKWSSYRDYLNSGNSLVDSNEKEMIMNMLGGSIDQFQRFHLKDDMLEFLEIKEDLEVEREIKARKILKDYCDKYKVKDIKQLCNNKDAIDEIVIDLLQLSKLSHRRVADLLGINRGIVHNIAKKI